MSNKIFIPSLGSKKLMVDKELSDLRKLLDRIEKEIHGQPINETCTKLIKRALTMASGNLGGCLNYKKFSDQGKK
jgi:type II secretory pathway predicted ATPase ExeA